MTTSFGQKCEKDPWGGGLFFICEVSASTRTQTITLSIWLFLSYGFCIYVYMLKIHHETQLPFPTRFS